MKCKECAEAKRIGGHGVLCIPYGMVIRDEHECIGKAGHRHERDDDQRQEDKDKTEIFDSGRCAVEGMPGVL